MKNLLHEYLSSSADMYPNNRAVVFNQSELTYKDLDERSTKIAEYLKSVNVHKGDRVAIFLGNTIETIIAFWGILKAGAVVIPMGIELKVEKIEYVIKDSGASVLFTRRDVFDINKINIKHSNLKRIVLIDQDDVKQEEIFESYSSIFSNKYEREKKQEPCVLSIDLCAIIYTSGSTGEPKGVMLTHHNMVSATHSLNTYLKYNEADRILCSLPLAFDYGLYQMIMSVSKGATLLLHKESTWPIFLIKSIVKEQATIFPAVPTMIMMIFEQSKKKTLNLSSIRAVTNTGAALTMGNIGMVKKLFPNADIFSMYGLTECKRCTYLPPEDIDRKPGSVGIAIPNTELWLVDEANNRITEPNQIGQLVIRGATVMKGYWNKLEKTAEKLKPGLLPNESVLYTGDYCSLDEEGYLYFKGRIDNMIKSRGIKVSPKEVEDFLHELPEVNSAVVTSVPSVEYGESLFAYITIEKEGEITEQEILSCCERELEVYKVPQYVRIIHDIPKTPNGKFNILELKKRANDEVSNIVLTS